MEQIDETKRKPRRTKGTPSYHYRNRFAAAGIAVGSAIFALWYFTPIFRIANEKLMHDLITASEEEKDRKLIFNLVGAPRTSRAIKETIEEKKQLLHEPNLKKLQLPSSSSSKQSRKTRQTAKTSGNTAITNYFLTPEKCSKDHAKEDTTVPPKDSVVVLDFNEPKTELPQTSNISPKPATRKRGKRTKLDNFIFKDPNDIPDLIKNPKSPQNDEDLVVPEKKAKKAPKLTLSSSQTKASKARKKQTTIKSAFLRNEQLFAEIAAQHCAADQFDGDDVQLALAISRSEAESKGIEVAKENELEEEVNLMEGNNSAESIRDKLKKYGFRTAEKNDYNTFAAAFLPKANGRRQKNKWANKFTALTLRTHENQMKKLQNNIEKLLNSQFRTKPLTDQESLQPLYKLQSSLLKKLNMHENNKILQSTENVNQSLDNYFVKDLFEINNLTAGHLLKDWTAIQGRDLTPNAKTKANKESLEKLQNIYKDLEEYFSSRKQLDWSKEDDKKEEQEVSKIIDKEVTKKDDVNEQAQCTKINENLEIMADDIANTIDNEKILKLLPQSTCLDVMQVSSCSINTQATINTTQREETLAQRDVGHKTIELGKESTNNELDEMIDLIEDMQRNESVIYPKATTTTSLERSHDNWIFAPERSESYSAKDCQPSDSCINRKFFPQERTISHSRAVTTTTTTSLQTTLSTHQQKEVSAAPADLKDHTLEVSDDSCTVKLDKRVDLIEDVQTNQADIENSGTHNNSTVADKGKDVSNASNQNSINATQNTRSNSPDLFADSDVEMEECDNQVDNNKTEVPTAINVTKDTNRNSSLEEVDEGVTTYEIFSSDEVKNTSLLEQNKSTVKDIIEYVKAKSIQCTIRTRWEEYKGFIVAFRGNRIGSTQKFCRSSSRVLHRRHSLLHQGRYQDNWISAPERPDSQSAKDCQLSNSCTNWKFFPQRRSSSYSQPVTTTTSSWEYFAPSISNIPLPCDDQVIDLTQYDLSPSPDNQSNHHLNQSKPIVEIDLFADSPSQDEDIDFTESPLQYEKKDHDLSDINRNSQISKYLQENKEETFKLTLSMETNEVEEHKESLKFPLETNKKEKSCLEKKTKEESFELSLITEVNFKENIMKEESLKFSLETSESEENFIEKFTKEESLEFTLDISDNEENFMEKKTKEESSKTQAKTKEKSFKLSLEISDNEETCFKKNEKEESFKLTLSLDTQEPLRKFVTNKDTYEDDDDIVLQEIAMDQTNTSFLNFQGSKQLETCFHKETATSKENKAQDITTKEKELIKDSLTANDTMFRELCNKYLNEPHNTSKELQKTDFNKTKSFTQILPSIKTPEKYDNYTNFTMDFDVTIDNNPTLKRKSTSFTAKTPPKYLSKSQSFSKSNLIDLTQNGTEDDNEDLQPAEDDDEEDDDCLVLSDDEINYSIWQANKTGKFHTSEASEQEDNDDEDDDDDVISIPDNDNASDEDLLDSNKEKIIEFPVEVNEKKNSSYLDLKDKEKSLIKVALTAEESYSDFGVLTSKYTTPTTPPLQDDMKFDRSDFGILEEHSEPIDYTDNLCTPTKVLTEASFLSSPTETTAPMKRYSNCHKSSQKFQNLINNLEANSPTNDFNNSKGKSPLNDLNDFDEFDRLVYTSPLKTLPSAKKPPEGIEQLLTAEISFKESKKSPVPEVSTTKQTITYKNKTYTVRYTSSPKPDYMKYSEAELLKELYNFGIKPLKRKQAVKMLEYIYNQTHPILMDEEVEDEIQPQEDVITLDDLERPCTSKEALKSKTAVTKTRDHSVILSNESPREAVENVLDVAKTKLNLQDSSGREMLRYSLDLKAELLDEQYILQTNVTKKPLLPFHIAWYNLVCSNPKLHETILMYEPIDLQEIYLFLKSLGYRYDPKDLKVFFDRRCIIFRYDLTSSSAGNGKTKDTNRHVRKSKKAKITKK
ncbi:Structure-specific endonuclease subunit SLX4 [Lucilia cuprina]|nr:Structure-specific endonuclease subunit SLX4 [Lucilia cuprina]